MWWCKKTYKLTKLTNQSPKRIFWKKIPKSSKISLPKRTTIKYLLNSFNKNESWSIQKKLWWLWKTSKKIKSFYQRMFFQNFWKIFPKVDPKKILNLMFLTGKKPFSNNFITSTLWNHPCLNIINTKHWNLWLKKNLIYKVRKRFQT